MKNDKEILYNMLGREIDNLLGYGSPLAMFSEPIKKFIFAKIDPYVSFFFVDDKFEVNMATDYAKEEITERLNNFKQKYNEVKDRENNENEK